MLAGALVSVFLVRGAFGSTGAAETITIKADGRIRERLDIRTDRVILIRTKNGSCRLKIRDGQAKITNADCPKNLCVTQGAIGEAGGMIVCLPHKVVISAVGDGMRGDGVDAVVR